MSETDGVSEDPAKLDAELDALRAQERQLRLDIAFAELRRLRRDPRVSSAVRQDVRNGAIAMLDDAQEWLASRKQESAA